MTARDLELLPVTDALISQAAERDDEAWLELVPVVFGNHAKGSLAGPAVLADNSHIRYPPIACANDANAA